MLEVLEAVHAADENKLAIRVLLRERVQGVDGVGRSGQVHFNVQKFLFLFQRVLRRDHKPQLIQIGEFDQIIGQHHMAVMDGIERTRVYADFFHIVVISMTLRPFDRLRDRRLIDLTLLGFEEGFHHFEDFALGGFQVVVDDGAVELALGKLRFPRGLGHTLLDFLHRIGLPLD